MVFFIFTHHTIHVARIVFFSSLSSSSSTTSLCRVRRRHFASIALMGAPGSGKTTVGRVLANRRGMRWLDVDDDVLEPTWGRSVAAVLKELGDAKFLEAEADALRKLTRARVDNTVLRLLMNRSICVARQLVMRLLYTCCCHRVQFERLQCAARQGHGSRARLARQHGCLPRRARRRHCGALPTHEGRPHRRSGVESVAHRDRQSSRDLRASV